MEQAIKKAIEGGWSNDDYHLHGAFGDIYLSQPYDRYINSHAILLDPFFWQALGKALGWKEKSGIFKEPGHFELLEWWTRWHSLIDHLASGGDADSFFNNSLKDNGTSTSIQ